MPTPQPGIFAVGTRVHHHLEFALRPGAPAAVVEAALAVLGVPAVASSGVNVVVGFGPELWQRLAPTDAPADLHPFRGS